MEIKPFSAKHIMLAITIIIAIIYALPNLYGEDPAIQVSSKNQAAISTDVSKIIANNLNEAKIKYTEEQQDDELLLRFLSTDEQITAKDILTDKLHDENVIIALNLAPKTPAWLSMLGAKPMKLGLDLRGGVHFLLDVDTNSLVKARANGDIKSLTQELRDQKIRYKKVSLESQKNIIIELKKAEDTDEVKQIARKTLNGYNIKISNSDNTKIIATLTPANMDAMTDYAIEKTITTLNNRVNELGVSEAIVQRQGDKNISVDLPGIQDTTRAKQILGKTATLRFHLVDESHDAQAAKSNGAPLGTKLYDYDGTPILLKNQVALSGSSITFAQAVSQDASPAVFIKLGGGGEALFHKITAKNIGNHLAVVYVETEVKKQLKDGEWITKHIPHEHVISAAVIRSALGSSFEVSGLSSQEEAENLALLLRSGSLAAPVDIVQEMTVGPSLGQANIEKGVLSVAIGSLLVVLFMLAYYRLFGLIANFALAFNVILIIAILSILGATLTLPGIAGIVLTVGMAVDANVLINERIREELRNGLSPRECISAGYDKAFTTIVDANVTTLIVAMVLFSLGSGSVKGFAITLSIGILASMVTAIHFTRAIIDLIYAKRENLTKLPIGI
ncbi:MAG: protein translocase subunit SecD [Legionellales bacterium]|jgi:preprotein translocase subunit SecD|nr:protein translocase subunit SecD [Legionellales bacterium]